MKTKIILLFCAISLITFATQILDTNEAQRRFSHITGRTSLRIDDYVPGAFVEHNLRGVDNLWRAFMSITFDGGDVFFGKANDSYGELVESNFDFATIIYHATNSSGDTIICVPNIRRLYIDGENVYISEEDETFDISIDETTLTLTSDLISDEFTIFKTEDGALAKTTFYTHWQDTILYPYTQYIYQDSATYEYRNVPPDTLPRGISDYVLISTHTSYSIEAWKDTIGTLHLIPPDTLPTDLEGWERDTTYHTITQRFWYDSSTEMLYCVPPDLLPSSDSSLVLLDSTREVCATFQPDSSYIGAWSQNHFGSFFDGWEIFQTLETDYVEDGDSADGFISVRLTIKSYTPDVLSGGLFMFLYDGDVPSAEADDDVAAFDYDRRTAFIYDQDMASNDVVGFSVYTDDSIQFGAFRDWYSFGRSVDTLLYTMQNPSFGFELTDSFWTYTDSSVIGDSTFYTDSVYIGETEFIDTLFGDVSVYTTIDIPDISPFDSFVITLGLIAGEGLHEEFLPAVDIFRDDTMPAFVFEPRNDRNIVPDDIKLRAYPNPFNATLQIDNPNNFAITIHDISGRTVAYLPQASTSWTPDETISSGIYLVRPVARNAIASKVILLK